MRAGEEGRRFAWRLGSSLLGEILRCAQNDGVKAKATATPPATANATAMANSPGEAGRYWVGLYWMRSLGAPPSCVRVGRMTTTK